MSSSIGKVSKEEYRRQKDLDAARKAGTAPAEVDEEGNAINPHIPQFMVQAPWYMDTGKPSLKHQRKPEDNKDHLKLNEWYQRGQKEAKAATKYRKGACENCGAMSHKTRDCLERPRKKGAKWTNKNIAADEIHTDLKGVDNDYEVKRDRWNGYDPAEHKKVVREYEAIEEARRKQREEEIDKQTSTDLSTAKKLARKQKKERKTSDGDFGSSDSDEEDEDKYAEKASMVGQKIDSDKRITVRNLRIREDRAKYLYNLNTNSAFYDPKTRSMREAPDPNIRPEDAQFAGDNFERSKGDVVKVQQLQMFAWQSEARGNDIHLQANPTVNELQHREYQQKKEKLNQQMKGSILERYGGSEHFDSVPKELLTGQTEQYVEYTPTGQPVLPSQRSLIAGGSGSNEETKAIENGTAQPPKLYDGNHKHPFGSWTDATTGKAGYDCCHSTVKNSYCTGEAGKEAEEASNILAKGKTKAVTPREQKEKEEEGKRRRRSRSFSSSSSSSSSSSRSFSSDSDSSDSRRRPAKRSRKQLEGYKSRKDIGEGDIESRLDKAKLKAALAEQDRQEKKASSSSRNDDDDDRPDWLKEAEAINKKHAGKFSSTQGDATEVSEEQLEAYRLKHKNNAEDPMANYRDEEE